MNTYQNRRTRRRTRGISVLEVLVGLALSAVVLVGIHSSQRAYAHALRSHAAAFDLQDQARASVDLMVRELRMAGYDPTGAALPTSPGPACPGVSQGLIDATATRVRIRADLTGDGTTLASGEDVIYQLDSPNAQILRTSSGGSGVLTDKVATDGLVFRYFDTSDPPVELVPAPSLTAAERDCVGTINVVVRLTTPNPNPAISSDLTSRATSQVAIRSRALTNF